MNVWISYNGIKDSPFAFPYKADNPITGKSQFFKDKKDVEGVINDILAKDSKVSDGQNLYYLTPLFCDQRLLLDNESQELIRKYNFCKTFNTPPASTINNTPIRIVEAFEIIETEINNCTKVNNGN